jgi:hypothetical protein
VHVFLLCTTQQVCPWPTTYSIQLRIIWLRLMSTLEVRVNIWPTWNLLRKRVLRCTLMNRLPSVGTTVSSNLAASPCYTTSYLTHDILLPYMRMTSVLWRGRDAYIHLSCLPTHISKGGKRVLTASQCTQPPFYVLISTDISRRRL